MEIYNNLSLKEEDNILFITVNRPDKLNALNVETIAELDRAFQYAMDLPSAKGIILTGSGDKAFVAGADISEIAALNEMNARNFAEKGQEVFDRIESSDKPVIAAVNGFALGGGCELSMACHIRIASPNAKFGQPEVNLGIIPGYGGTQRLPGLVGRGRALELMMTGDMIDAQEAYRIGLVNRISESQESLMEECRALMNKILSKAPLAIGMIIDCVNSSHSAEEKGYQTEANLFASCCKTDDFKEGTQAFMEKRKADFQGK